MKHILVVSCSFIVAAVGCKDDSKSSASTSKSATSSSSKATADPASMPPVTATHPLPTLGLSVTLTARGRIIVATVGDAAEVAVDCTNVPRPHDRKVCARLLVERAPDKTKKESSDPASDFIVEDTADGWIINTAAPEPGVRSIRVYKRVGETLYHCYGTFPEATLREACATLAPS